MPLFFSLLRLHAVLVPFVFGQLPPLSCSQASVTGDFFNPTYGQGSFLDKVSNGLGEPLNVIISAKRSKEYLQDDASFMCFANAFGFGKECSGIHLCIPQMANLGDGRGWVNQTMELRTNLRYMFGDPLGRQSSSDVAPRDHVSLEEGLSKHHTILPNGYDLGCEHLVEAAVGKNEYGFTGYYTTAYNVTGCIKPGSEGINHDIATDGTVTVLQVEIIYYVTVLSFHRGPIVRYIRENLPR